MMILSVIVPAYNEERTLGVLLNRIQQVPVHAEGFELELIVVNDCSTDRTQEIAQAFPVKLVNNEVNQGKGASVRKGVDVSTGGVILVQDADLEYDPMDYIPLLRAWRELANKVGPQKAVVYGSRLLGQLRKRVTIFPGRHPRQGLGPWGANLALSLLTFFLTASWFTDLLTAYKLYPGHLLRKLQTKTNGFETDHELTMRLRRRGCYFKEVPIEYSPRTSAEGKKIKAIDFVHAVRTLVAFRFMD